MDGERERERERERETETELTHLHCSELELNEELDDLATERCTEAFAGENKIHEARNPERERERDDDDDGGDDDATK